VAVQLGLPVKPVTVKAAGAASEALAEAGETLPLAQDRLTLTEVPLLGTKSLLTLNWAVLRVLVMVQLPALRAALQVPLEV
jgi:hypothetical protein